MHVFRYGFRSFSEVGLNNGDYLSDTGTRLSRRHALAAEICVFSPIIRANALSVRADAGNILIMTRARHMINVRPVRIAYKRYAGDSLCVRIIDTIATVTRRWMNVTRIEDVSDL